MLDGLGSNSNEFTFVSVWKDLSDLKGIRGKGLGEGRDTAECELPLLEETFIHHFELFQ